MLFTVPSTGGFKRKPYSTLVLKKHIKKSTFMKSIFRRKNEGRKPDKPVLGDSSLCPETLTRMGAQEFHLWRGRSSYFPF
jgi:hypothetical protein